MQSKGRRGGEERVILYLSNGFGGQLSVPLWSSDTEEN